jgi:hypothetical protein
MESERRGYTGVAPTIVGAAIRSKTEEIYVHVWAWKVLESIEDQSSIFD